MAITLTPAQRELLTARQRRQFRQLNLTQQRRVQNRLIALLREQREDAQRARARARRQQGARTTPAPIFSPPGGNPMDAVQALGSSLSLTKSRRRPGQTQEAPA